MYVNSASPSPKQTQSHVTEPCSAVAGSETRPGNRFVVPHRCLDHAVIDPLPICGALDTYSDRILLLGAVVDRIRASKDFLRHQGASRDTQRTGLNTRRDSEAGSVRSAMPSGRHTPPDVHSALLDPPGLRSHRLESGRGPPSVFSGTSSQKRDSREANKALLQGLLEDNRSLHDECKQMKHVLSQTKARMAQIEGGGY